MNDFLTWAKAQLQVDRKLIATYCIVYFIWGLFMNWFGTQLEIAKFTYWWQVITCYIVYMVPISMLLRRLPYHMQYAYGLVAMGLLEFGGYFFETSYAYPGNMIEEFFGIRNFALAMALFFALYFPLGNWGVGKIYRILFQRTDAEN
ncbi:hypothetical protein [Pareuzebyella sediminis]|uniref:hypothetical protein n=1 Tax=Pareuzebyella sediminis TaxID=2607998 RepID=UPI0011EC1EC7|nr:hypothetical protein [Pareuzebyella sediminis]